MVEFALVVPVLLLIFAAAADFGRAFYAYIAVENAAKEGAFFGSRNPLCDDGSGPVCANPNNVVWHVQQELKNQGLRNPNNTELVPTIRCLAPDGTPRADVDSCLEGDTYEVVIVYPFRLLTPIVGSVIGNLNLSSASRAVVLNLAFDPTPGASIQKLVSPTGATNEAEIVAKCLEPDDHDSAGFYRSPCLDSSTADPSDKLKITFEQGAVIQYKLTVGNSGAQTLSTVTVADSRGSTGCSFPGTLGVGFTVAPCTYTRTAPAVPGSATAMDYANTATVDSAQTLPATDTVTVTVAKPPARLRVLKWVSPYRLGNDGDGTPGGFGTTGSLDVSWNPQVPTPSTWFWVIVRNTGGQTATGVGITDSRGSLPFNQHNANADCSAAPSTLAAGAQWECFYKVTFSSASPAANANTVSVTATNVVPDGDDSATATVQVSACSGSNRVIPMLVGLGSASAAQAAWTAAGFTGTLSDVDGHNSQTVEHQGRQAFLCLPATTGMTFGNDPS